MALTTNSFMERAIASFRRNAEEPAINAKYTDAVIITMLEEAYAHVVAEIIRCSPEPVVARYSVSIVADTTAYLLPPLIKSIQAIYSETTSGYKVFLDARGPLNPAGREVWVEGNILRMQSHVLIGGDTLIVEYIPSGTARLHDGACTVDSTGKIITLAATPSNGALDTRLNAYAGSTFRLISTADVSGNYNFIQEVQISSYARATRAATLLVALDPNLGDGTHSGTITYEIAPAIHQGLDHAIAMYLAWCIVSIEGSVTRAHLLRRMWQDIVRNLRLSAYYSNLMEAGKWRGDTFQNARFMGTRGRRYWW